MVRCPKCGEAYEGRFCPNCGTPAPGSGRAERTAAAYGNAGGGFIRAGRRPDAPGIDAALRENADGALSRAVKRDRTLSMCASVLSLAAVLAVLVFTFFTGMTLRGSVFGESIPATSETGYGTMNLYHFFYRAFANISDYGPFLTDAETVSCYAVAVLGLLISAGMIFTMVGMACRCAVKAYRSFKSGDPLDMRRDVAMTYMLYVAFCLMFRSLLYEYESYSGIVAELDLNGATIAGLAAGGALAAASLVCDFVRSFAERRKGRMLGKAALAAASTALVIAAAWFLTGKATGFSSVGGSTAEYCFGYLKYAVYLNSTSVFVYGLVAQVFMTGALLIMCFFCAGLLSSVTDKYSFSRPNLNAFMFICFAVAFVAGICAAVNAMDFYSDSMLGAAVQMGGSDLAFSICGIVACVVGIFVNYLAKRVYNKGLRGEIVSAPGDGDEEMRSDEE